MSNIVLYDYAKSSAAYRVRIGLNLKGVEYESRPVNLLESEQKGEAYRSLNPQGFVPMLEVDHHRITQSLAILVYLDQAYPDPRLMPADPFDGAHVRAFDPIAESEAQRAGLWRIRETFPECSRQEAPGLHA